MINQSINKIFKTKLILLILLPILFFQTTVFLRHSRTLCSLICPHTSTVYKNNITFDKNHVIDHYPDFICSENFRNLADWIYGWPHVSTEHIHSMTNDGSLIAPCLPDGSIIYVHTATLEAFFHFVYPRLKNKFVLITGASDKASPTYLGYLDAPDSKIIHWFGQNGQIHPFQSNKFTHIPIGINCYEMADALRTIHADHKRSKIPTMNADPDEPLGYIQPVDVSQISMSTNYSQDQLVLINFKPETDFTGQRQKIWSDLCSPQSGMKFSFGECYSKPHGVQIENLPTIYRRNRHYPFWLSPRGNGLDCHRTWEALYLDIIPIVWNSTLNVLYEDLPVLIINDHRELNASFLYAKLNEIGSKKLSSGNYYRYEKLRNAHWRRLILEKSRHKGIQVIPQHLSNRCWIAKLIDGDRKKQDKHN